MIHVNSILERRRGHHLTRRSAKREYRMTTPVSSFASNHCDTLASPNPYTTSLSILLVLGIFVSYIPQHYKIIKCGTSEGLSPWWVLLGGLSSIAAMGNILTLPASREDMMCCREISGGACASALLGVVQIGVQWGCFMFVYASHSVSMASYGGY